MVDDGSRSSRLFATHVVAFVIGVAAAGGGIVEGSSLALALGGVCITAAGVLSLILGRSVAVPTGLRGQADAGDPERREAAERASAWMSGTVLSLLGAIVAAMGVGGLL